MVRCTVCFDPETEGAQIEHMLAQFERVFPITTANNFNREQGVTRNKTALFGRLQIEF